jgi:hypothetical protein
MLRYEDLISDPTDAVKRITTVSAPQMHPIENALVPSLAELHYLDDRFFRRGHTGTHRDEMTDELQQVFWSSGSSRPLSPRPHRYSTVEVPPLLRTRGVW